MFGSSIEKIFWNKKKESELTLSIGKPMVSHSGSSSLLPLVVVAKKERSANDMPSNDIFVTLILAWLQEGLDDDLGDNFVGLFTERFNWEV